MAAAPELMQSTRHKATREQSPNSGPLISASSVRRACTNLLRCEPEKVQYPGGASRCSVRAIAGNKAYIVTRRKLATRAELEAGVLQELRAAGAPVPAVLAYDGEWLIQEDLGLLRLSAALGATDRRAAGNLAAQAIDGLLLCQRAAEQVKLAQRVAPIGVKPGWLSGLLSIPGRLADRLGLADPDLASVITPEALTPRRYAFVKWDARPGNALLINHGAGGGVGWIDWEHCGARDALDDLAWLLCDEYMPDPPALEAALLKRFLPLFASHSSRSEQDALVYLSRFGCLHTCMRLHLILQNKGEGGWWSADACERTDRVGVTAEAAHRLCRRGARWSRRFPGGERLHTFFCKADKRLRYLSVDSSALPAKAAPIIRNTPAARRALHQTLES